MSSDLVQILEGNTFVVSDRNGDIDASPVDATGLFAFDTRFLSKWALTIDGERLNALSTDDLHYYETRFFLVPGTGTVYIDAKLSVIRQRTVGRGFSEQLTILNHDDKPVSLEVRIEAGSDFADLFEVKDQLKKKGSYFTRAERNRLVLGYRRETFERETWITSSERAQVDEHGLTFKVKVPAHGEWTTQLDVVTASSVVPGEPSRVRRLGSERMARGLDKWIQRAPHLACDSDSLRATYHRSLVDLAALRFSTRTMPKLAT